jgi:hypothetical protein
MAGGERKPILRFTDRLTVGLVLVIGAVHAALEAGAVPDAEHVAGLVHGNLKRPT